MQVEQLSYRYGTRTILNNVSFTLSYGQSVCLLGKNGVGKSTLFKCLLGILKPASGTVQIDGISIEGKSRQELAQLISYIPQKQQTVFAYSVFEMVLMGTAATLKSWQQPGKKEYNKALEALDTLQISHLKNQRFSEISGGEQQLTIIARSIAQQSRIIMMDEPCSSLDFSNQIKVLEMTQQLAKAGYLIIQSTHDPNHALQYSDEVLILKNGQCEQGTPEAILTTSRLEQLYQVPVKIYDFGSEGQKVCVALKKETNHVDDL